MTLDVKILKIRKKNTDIRERRKNGKDEKNQTGMKEKHATPSRRTHYSSS